MKKINDFIICNGFGLGQIKEISNRDIGDETITFYHVKIEQTGMTVMIPINKKDSYRSLGTIKDVEESFALLENHNVSINKETWNQRYRYYASLIRSGKTINICEIIRDLKLKSKESKLMYGERNMLSNCLDIISIEFSKITNKNPEDIIDHIENIFA